MLPSKSHRRPPTPDGPAAPMSGPPVESMDDDPPPYSAVVPPDHAGWHYGFPGRPSDSAAAPLRADPEGPAAMPYRLFICGSGRTVLGFDDDDVPDTKEDGARTTRKYGAILVGAAVIIFLMVLSLLVRFVMDKNLWRA